MAKRPKSQTNEHIEQTGGGAVVSGGGVAASTGGAAVGGNVGGDIIMGSTVIKNYVQDRDEVKQVARQMSHRLNEFEKRFNAIRYASPKEMSDRYGFAEEKLNQIMNEDLPRGDLVFKEAHQIREKILLLQRKYNGYGSSLVSLITEIKLKAGVFNTLEIMKGLWGLEGEPPSLTGQVNLLIRELVELLNKEYRNEA